MSLTRILEDHDQYADLLRALVTQPDICASPGIQRQFGFTPMLDSDGVLVAGKYRLWTSSPLNAYLRGASSCTSDQNGDLMVDSILLERSCRLFSTQRLYGRILTLYERVNELPTFRICLNFANKRECSQPCSESHESLTQQVLDQRVLIQFQQIMMLRHLASLPCSSDLSNRLKKAARCWRCLLFTILIIIDHITP